MADPYDKPGTLPDNDELRRRTGIIRDDEQGIDARAAAAADSPEQLAEREGLFNAGGDGPAKGAKAAKAGELKSAEQAPGNQLYNPEGDKRGGLRGRLQNARGRASKLAQNKWLVGGILGGGSGVVVLLILLVLLAGSLKIPHLAQNIAAYQMARLSRQYSRAALRVTDESLAVATTNDRTYSKLQDKYRGAKTKTAETFSKLDKYRASKVMQNLQANNNLQLTYQRRGISGSPRLIGITLSDSTHLAPKQGLTRFVPGLREAIDFKNNVTYSKTVAPDLIAALRANDIGPIVRGQVAKRIRQQLGIGLVAWTLGKYSGKTEAKARLQVARDMYEKMKARNLDTPVSEPIKKGVETATEAAEETINDDKKLQATINNGGASPGVKSAITKALQATKVTTALKFANPVYAMAMPACIIYDGSLENSGPTIDNQTRQQQAAFYFIESAADQQKNGSTPGADDSGLATAVGATNALLGDVDKSNAIVRSAGGSVNPVSSVSAEAGAGGEFTLLDATPGIPGPVASTIESIAGKACPKLTNIWFATSFAALNIGITVLTGGTVGGAEKAAGTAATKVIEKEAANFATRFILKSKAVSGTAGKLIYDTGKSAAKITAATVVAKLVVASRAGQVNSGFAQDADLANIADAGAFIHAGEIERQGLGGRALTQKEATQSSDADRVYIAQQNSRQSFYSRYISTNNANSLLSKTAMAVGGSFNGSVSKTILKLGAIIIKPLTYLGDLLMPFNGHAKAAINDSSYGNVTFGWSEDEEALIDSSNSYEPLENQGILDASGKEDAINKKYGKCFTETLGTLLAEGDIQRDSDGNVLEAKGLCSPKNLGVKNPNYGDLVFRWRLAKSYDTALDQLTDMQNVD